MNQLKQNVFTVQPGYFLRRSILPDYKGNVRLLTPKSISLAECLDLNNATKITIPNPEKYFIQDKDILLTSRGRFLAMIFNAPQNSNFIASSAFHRLQVTDKNFLPEYVVLYLNSKEGQKDLESRRERTTVSALMLSHLKELSIPLISLEEQKKLIGLSSAFLNWKTLRQRQDELQSTLINQIISTLIGEQNG